MTIHGLWHAEVYYPQDNKMSSVTVAYSHTMVGMAAIAIGIALDDAVLKQ